MRKFIKTIVAIVVILILTLNYTIVFATPKDLPSGEISNSNGGTPPDKPDGNAPGGSSGSSNVSHTGSTEISSDTTNNGQTYSSTTGSQNALLVAGGISTISKPVITKSGDSDGDNSDFYGTNAAVLAKEGTLNINGGTVTTENNKTSQNYNTILVVSAVVFGLVVAGGIVLFIVNRKEN